MIIQDYEFAQTRKRKLSTQALYLRHFIAIRPRNVIWHFPPQSIPFFVSHLKIFRENPSSESGFLLTQSNLTQSDHIPMSSPEASVSSAPDAQPTEAQPTEAQPTEAQPTEEKKEKEIDLIRCGKPGKSGAVHLTEYFSDDKELFQPPKMSKFQLGLGVVIAFLLSPFFIAFAFSYYCVCLVIATFSVTLLVSCALSPICAALDGRVSRFASAMVGLFTSSPVVAMLAFIVVKIFKTLWDVLKDYLQQVIVGFVKEGKKFPDNVSPDTVWEFLKGKIVLVIFGFVCFGVTFWAPGCAVILGMFPFSFVILFVLVNFGTAFLTYFLEMPIGLAAALEAISKDRSRKGSDSAASESDSAPRQPNPPPGGYTPGISDVVLQGVKGVVIFLGTLVPEIYGQGEDDEEEEDSSDSKEKKKKPAITPIMAMVSGLDYFWIGNFAGHILDVCVKRGKRVALHFAALFVTTILNITVLAIDGQAYNESPLSYFLGAICLRGIFLPVLVVFHPLVGFIFHTPDAVLQWAFRGATILAVLLLLLCPIGAVVVRDQITSGKGLLYTVDYADGWTREPENQPNTAVCTNRYENLSVIELVGLALAGYHVDDRDGFADSRIKDGINFFFGYRQRPNIQYEVVELDPDVPLMIYNVSGTIVFGFRGFATGAELAVQVERLASLYVVPYVLEELPFYGKINDEYLSSGIAMAHLFGWHWFSPRSVVDDLVQKAGKIYDDRGFSEADRVVFVGINSGGTIAKRLALLKRRRGIGFVSLPIDADEFDNRYDLEDTDKQWVTNVFNIAGRFSGEDTGFGENFALAGDPDILRNDNVYESICNLAEICGHHRQFNLYCRQMTTWGNWEKIVEYYHPEEEDE